MVVDMSSNIMTKKIDVSKVTKQKNISQNKHLNYLFQFGIIIAAVQKIMGTAGLGLVIIREDLLGNAIEMCPSILNFKQVADYDSILNTPPIFS